MSEVLPDSVLAALHRRMLWEEARASVALDRDEHVRTISLDEMRGGEELT